MMKGHFDITDVEHLDSEGREALWGVYRRHFDAQRSDLDASLARADQVIRFWDERRERMIGLLVMSLTRAEHRGRVFYWLWAGALAIDREYRGSWLLERSGATVLLRFRARHPFAALYWIYESFSFQSYRMMARSFSEFYPQPSCPTPAWERSLVHRLASERFPDRWDSEAEVLRAVASKKLRGASARTKTPTNDPLRRFYEGINPYADQGASVVLLSPLGARNAATLALRSGRRMLSRGRRRA